MNRPRSRSSQRPSRNRKWGCGPRPPSQASCTDPPSSCAAARQIDLLSSSTAMRTSLALLFPAAMCVCVTGVTRLNLGAVPSQRPGT
eukprot:2113946-Prymnesium_polylepis.1